MRHLISAFALLLATSLYGKIETGYTRYFSDEELRTVASYFGDETDLQQRFRTIIPSHENSLGGQYFIIRQSEPATQPVKAVIQYFSSDSKDPKSATFTLPDELSNWLYFGLTQNDWPSADVKTLAWKLELFNANNEVVSSWKSFLWEMD